MLRFLIGVIACLCTSGLVHAESGRIEGVVRASNQQVLSGATVIIEGAGRATRTNAYGQYSFAGLRPGNVVTLAVTFGDLPVKKTTAYVTEGTTFVDFILEVATIVEEVTVEAEIPLLNATDNVSGITLSPAQIAVLPSLGEKDIFRALQLLPGVSGSRESSSGLYVRGGTPAQNLISYDGFTVYHVDHLFGYFSAFNMDAVEQVSLSKAAFNACDGGRLSSVLDLAGKSGRRDRPSASVGVSLLSVSALAETPVGDKASLLLAGRRSFQGPLYQKILDLFGDTDGGGPRVAGRPGFGRFALFESEPSSYFYDANAKLLFELSTNDKLSLSLYKGQDTVDNSRSLTIPDFMRERMTEQGIAPPSSFDVSDTRKWSNLGLGAQWHRSWSRGIETSLALGRSTFSDMNERASQASESGAGNVEDNELKDLTARFDLKAPLSSSNTFEIGVALTRNDIEYQFDSSSDTRVRPDFAPPEGTEAGSGEFPAPNIARPQFGGQLDRDDQASQLSAYAQDRWTLFTKVVLTPGLRVTRYDATGKAYPEPRISATAAITNRLRLKGAYSIQHQFANRITREDASRGDREFWTLSDGTSVPVARSRQAAAGASYETRDLLVDVEIFHKRLDGLSQFAPVFAPRDENEANDLQQFFYQGNGLARGLEILIQKKFGRNTGWLSYTLSRVTNEFPDLQAGFFLAGYDQTHELKVVDSLRLGRWTFSGTWIYATGQPYTEPAGVETTDLAEGFAFDRLILGERNAARLPSYHRMDLAAGFEFRLGEARGTVSATLFNAYNHRNVWYKEFQIVEGEVLENDILLMGLTLNISASMRF